MRGAAVAVSSRRPLRQRDGAGVALLLRGVVPSGAANGGQVASALRNAAKRAYMVARLSRWPRCAVTTATQARTPRICEPTYLAEVQVSGTAARCFDARLTTTVTTADALGRAFEALGCVDVGRLALARCPYMRRRQRRARILSEELKQGTTMFLLRAVLVRVASVSLSLSRRYLDPCRRAACGDELWLCRIGDCVWRCARRVCSDASAQLKRKTSGAATVQLVRWRCNVSASLVSARRRAAQMFADFEELPVDPLFKPTTAAELAAHDRASGALAPDTARLLVEATRRRKGLFVEEQVVDADKQRTLSKTK